MAMLDSSNDPTQPNSEYTLYIIAGGVAAILLSIILFVFASNVNSRELYHGYYLLASFVLVGGFGVSIAFKRFGIAVSVFILLALVMIVSIMKFNARAAINAVIQDSSTQTILATDVVEVPVWEKRVIPFFNTPKWVEFDKECFRPSLVEDGSVGADCATKESIYARYRISVMSLINSRYSKLHNTAVRIRNQEFPDRASYEGCVNAGYCAEVPLLPSSVMPDSIAETSSDYKDIRQSFWQLVDNETIQVDYCESMDLCAAMTKIGAVDRRDFQENL